MKPFVVLGHTPEGDRIRDDQQTSLLTFGSSGSGKTNLLIENALTYEGSFIGLDVTGELAVVTAHRRAEFSDTYLINPYGVFREELAGIPTVRYNPLSCLDPKDDTRFGALSEKIAEGCVRDGSGHDLFFYSGARHLVRTLIEVEASYAKS